MKKNKFLKFFLLCLMVGATAMFTGCSDDDDDSNNNENNNDNNGENDNKYEGNTDRVYFHLLLGVGDDGNDGTLAQTREDLSASASPISFNNYGFEVPSTRTAHVVGSENGKYLYVSDYGGGKVTKFVAKGGQTYSDYPTQDDATIIVRDAVGSSNPRWGKVSDEMALLHNITTERKYKDAEGTEYDYTTAYANLVGINLGGDADMSMGSVQKLEIPRSQEDNDRNLNIWRIDAPVIKGGKVYYGVAKRSYDPATGNNVTVSDYATTTLVADYPSLTNLKTIESTQCTGENYGYRTPVNYLDEKGDIYQIVGNGRRAMMLKITNEAYDNTYTFDLSNALGFEVGALGWFYVGDGIGYVPFYDLEKGQAVAESAWGVARIDVYNKTAVKMNISGKLWLRQYQNGVLKDGKFYMALAPVGEKGAVYMFDPTSTSADGFEIGATLDNLGGQFYIGIF